MKKLDRKAQALMVVLWVMVALVMLALGIGNRVSLGLKLGRYQASAAKSYYLTRAAVSEAVAKIKAGAFDNADLRDGWKGIVGESASYEVLDEERKVNINRTGDLGVNQLSQMLIFHAKVQPREAQEAARACIERIKSKSLSSRIELLSLLENFYQGKPGDYKGRARQIYQAIADSVTVSTDGPVNINTAPVETLDILIEALLNTYPLQSVGPSDSSGLVDRIKSARDSGIVFDKDGAAGITSKLEGSGDKLSVAQQYIINQLCAQGLLTVEPKVFRIAAVGSYGKVRSSIVAEYDSAGERIVYWHEK
jgi:type II secretory pathway component PulK